MSMLILSGYHLISQIQRYQFSSPLGMQLNANRNISYIANFSYFTCTVLYVALAAYYDKNKEFILMTRK